MKTKLARWGNSLAIRLPAEVVREFGLSEGQVLELKANKPMIEITAPPGSRRYVAGIPAYTIEELVARMKPEDEPEAIEWGPDRGSEIIDDEYSRSEITLGDVLRGRPSKSR